MAAGTSNSVVAGMLNKRLKNKTGQIDEAVIVLITCFMTKYERKISQVFFRCGFSVKAWDRKWMLP